MYIILLFFCEKIISSSLHNIHLAKRKGRVNHDRRYNMIYTMSTEKHNEQIEK